MRSFFHARQATLLGFLAILLTTGCERTPLAPDRPAEVPAIQLVRIGENLENRLGATVTIRARNAVSARVEILGDVVIEPTTPVIPLRGDSAVIPILGLSPHTTYKLRTWVYSAAGVAATNGMIEYTTGSLPDSIPTFTVLSSTSPSVRYVMLGITPARNGKSFAVIVNKRGIPVWYKEFKDAVADFQKQPNGRYTAFSSLDGSASHFYEFGNRGEIANEYTASNGRETGPHELRLTNGGYALFGIEFRVMDLTGVGGLSNATVRGLVVEYYSSGPVPFQWNTFDHLEVTDAANDIPLDGANVNPWHGNAIDIDVDGNLLVSFRNMDEIIKIDSQTGEIIWRLGGRHNDFTFINDALNGFSHQHGVRRLANGNIILFDNGNLHSPPVSRAVEYKLNEVTKVAELVWEYKPNPAKFGFALGFAQRLPNGNTLICFGTAQSIVEVNSEGALVWEIAIDEPLRYAYRALAIDSLY